jgi:hypothetical protein
VLVALLVSAVGIGVREFGVACFFNVSVVANGEICTCAEGWSEVD